MEAKKKHHQANSVIVNRLEIFFFWEKVLSFYKKRWAFIHWQVYTAVLLDFDILVELISEILLLKDIHDASDEYKAYECFKQSNKIEASIFRNVCCSLRIFLTLDKISLGSHFCLPLILGASKRYLNFGLKIWVKIYSGTKLNIIGH